LSRDESAAVQHWALHFLLAFCSCLEIDPTGVDGLIPRCEEELSKRDVSALFRVLPVLLKYAPDTEGLVDALTEVLSHEQPGYHHWAVGSLAQLGSRAAPAVPKLVNLLAKPLEEPPGRERVFVPLFPGPDEMEGTTVREEIIDALGAIGPGAAAALPLLEKIASMEPADTGGTGLDVTAKEAIARIKATGGDSDPK